MLPKDNSNISERYFTLVLLGLKHSSGSRGCAAAAPLLDQAKVAHLRSLRDRRR